MQNSDSLYNEELIYKIFPNLSPKQKEQIGALYPLYEDWNSKINVISRKDIEKLYLHHVLHSLAIAKFIELSNIIKFGNGTKILDVGTGGGFPGIPLAIMFPQADFLLIDSIGKKIKVVEEIAGAIGLKNVRAVKARAEEITDNFDYIVSRAVTDLSTFFPWVRGKYSKGIIYLKGGDITHGGTLATEIDNALGITGIKRKSITICEIDTWFKDEFFKEKKVIFIPR
ncbi:MAG: 16S rRNA (guanine(527)-N(7))-methyltransferase RsmG [Bacteroidales bacterium]